MGSPEIFRDPQVLRSSSQNEHICLFIISTGDWLSQDGLCEKRLDAVHHTKETQITQKGESPHQVASIEFNVSYFAENLFQRLFG